MNYLKKFGFVLVLVAFCLSLWVEASYAQGRAGWKNRKGNSYGWTRGQRNGWDNGRKRGWRNRNRYVYYSNYPRYSSSRRYVYYPRNSSRYVYYPRYSSYRVYPRYRTYSVYPQYGTTTVYRTRNRYRRSW